MNKRKTQKCNNIKSKINKYDNKEYQYKFTNRKLPISNFDTYCNSLISLCTKNSESFPNHIYNLNDIKNLISKYYFVNQFYKHFDYKINKNLLNIKIDKIELKKNNKLFQHSFRFCKINDFNVENIQMCNFAFSIFPKINLNNLKIVFSNFQYVNMQGAICKNIQAIGVNFSYANLANCNFTNGKFSLIPYFCNSNNNFDKSKNNNFFKIINLNKQNELFKTQFQYTNLENVDFENADLRNIDLGTCFCNDTNFKNSDLSNTINTRSLFNFNIKNFSGVFFNNTDLSAMTFRDLVFSDTKFINTILHNTKFIGCTMFRAKLSGKKYLSNALFKNVRGIKEIFLQLVCDKSKNKNSSTTCLKSTIKVPQINEKKSIDNFTQTVKIIKFNFKFDSLKGKFISGIDISKVYFDNITFQDSILTHVNFSSGRLQNIEVNNSSLHFCSFENIFLINVNFIKTNLNNINFKKCTFINVAYKDCYKEDIIYNCNKTYKNTSKH